MTDSINRAVKVLEVIALVVYTRYVYDSQIYRSKINALARELWPDA